MSKLDIKSDIKNTIIDSEDLEVGEVFLLALASEEEADTPNMLTGHKLESEHEAGVLVPAAVSLATGALFCLYPGTSVVLVNATLIVASKTASDRETESCPCCNGNPDQYLLSKGTRCQCQTTTSAANTAFPQD